MLPAALLVALASAGPSPEALVPFAEIGGEPGTFLGRPVRVALQFHSLEKTWNPYLTRFGTREWIAARAWADEQLPWIEEEYAWPGVRVFARRGSAAAAVLEGARPHERFLATATVRELFAGRPWVEVTDVVRSPEEIPEGSVLHAVRALELMGREAFELADSELERALAAPLPEHAWEELVALRKRCLAGGGRDR